jgi:hypothetical protein
VRRWRCYLAHLQLRWVLRLPPLTKAQREEWRRFYDRPKEE